MTPAKTQENPLLVAALAYAAKGWPVFPCHPQTKRPLTGHGFHDASDDPAMIRRWWERWPSAMVAAPTGPAMGAWVLDVDDPAVFEAGAAKKGISLPSTRKATSGAGYHLYFTWDESRPVKNAQKTIKGWAFPELPGCDARGDGGYIILPPSVHPSGRLYSWAREEETSEAPSDLLGIIRRDRPHPEPVAEPPARADIFEHHGNRLLRAIRGDDDHPYCLAALRSECEAVRSAGSGEQEGTLNGAALRIGHYVGGGNLRFETAAPALITAGLSMTAANPSDPWTPEIVTAKVTRALHDGARDPKHPPAADLKLVSSKAVEVDASPNEGPLVAASPYTWRNPATLKPREWVYGRSIQRGHVRAIVAQGGAGKTILSVGEALAMVTGRDILGQRVVGGPKRVWLWNLEDDMDELARIIQAACKHWNIAEADIGGRLFVDSALDGAILKLAQSGVATGLQINRPLVEALTAELIARKIDYLHVDPFVSSHAVNENDNMEIDAVAKEWALVAKNGNCGIGLAHHVSKAGAAEATALSARGAGSLINACRSVLVLNRMTEDEAKRYGIEDEKRRRYFRVYDDKNNRAPPSDQSDWFRMLSVELGNDDFGGDNMGVVVPWSPPDPFEGVSVDHLYRVQSLIDQGEYKAHHTASNWAGQAVASVFGLDVDDKASRTRIINMLRVWIANGALVVDERRDANRQIKKYLIVGRWANDESATPAGSVAVQGVAAEQQSATLHTSPRRGGGVASAARPDGRVSQNRFVAGNPALGPVGDDDPAVAAFDRGERYGA